MKFYSVAHYEHDDYAQNFGYFEHLSNAMTQAIKAVANIQDEIVMMRTHCEENNTSIENYKDDMARITDTERIEWRGNYNLICIHEIETED